jgi:hypothetical protein
MFGPMDATDSHHDFCSKLLAGGLSAGIFLIWWADHYPGQGLGWLVLRGTLWTLCFEFMLHAFAPVERLAWQKMARPGLVGRARRVAGGLLQRAPHARMAVTLTMAGIGLAVPLVLFGHAAGRSARPATGAPAVVSRVIVQRPIIERKVIVRREVVPVADSTPRPVLIAAPPIQRIRYVTRTIVKRTKVRSPAPATPSLPAAPVSPPASSAPSVAGGGYGQSPAAAVSPASNVTPAGPSPGAMHHSGGNG